MKNVQNGLVREPLAKTWSMERGAWSMTAARRWPTAARAFSMARELKGAGIVVGLAVLLSGCSTTSVQTQTKAGANFSQYHTFALMPLPASGPASDPGLMLRVGEPARQAVIEALTAKGLTQADRGQADIAVNLKGSSLPKTEVTQWGYSPTPISGGANPNYWSPGGTMPTVYHFDERTLTIEIYDNHEKGVVWVGWGKWDSTGEVKVDKLQEAIRKILAKFPAGATGSK